MSTSLIGILLAIAGAIVGAIIFVGFGARGITSTQIGAIATAIVARV